VSPFKVGTSGGGVSTLSHVSTLQCRAAEAEETLEPGRKGININNRRVGARKEEPFQDINSYIEVQKKDYSYLNHHHQPSKHQASPNSVKNKFENSNKTNLKGVIFGVGDSKGKSEYRPVCIKNIQSSSENFKIYK